MRDLGMWLGAKCLAGMTAVAMLASAGCGDLGANPNTNNNLYGGGSGGNGGSGGSGGPAVCPSNITPGKVKQILAANCTACHGTQLLAGAPMPLVTWSDLHKPATTNP